MIQVWLPFEEKDLFKNKGLISDLGLYGRSYSLVEKSPVLKSCITFTGEDGSYVQGYKGFNDNKLRIQGDFSWCGWFKSTYNSSSENYLFSVNFYPGVSGYALKREEYSYIIYSSSSQLTFNASSSEDGSLDTWHHIAYVRRNLKEFILVDGKIQAEVTSSSRPLMNYTPSSNLTFGCQGDYTGERVDGSFCSCSISDFRIYDHALSLKELSEIKKGLIVHYPMNDVTSTTSCNLLKGWRQTQGWYRNHVTSDLSFERQKDKSLKITLSYTGTGSDHWPLLNFKFCNNFIKGFTYDYSLKIRIDEGTRENVPNCWYRAARCHNDWYGCSTMNILNTRDGEWHEYHLQQTLPSNFDANGTTINTSPIIELCFDNYATASIKHNLVFYIKDLQIACSGEHVPFMDGAFATKTVYDTSGFGHHGAVTTESAPFITTDSPRNDCGYYFNGTSNFIILPQESKVTDHFSACVWASAEDWSTTSGRLFSSTESGGWNIENANGYINFSVYANGSYQHCTSSKKWSDLTSGWHHFAIVYDGCSSYLYIDGIIHCKKTFFDEATPVTYNLNNTIFIGAEATGDTSTVASGLYFAGRMSDFRLYGTALTSENILELYNKPISIDNCGKIFTQGEYKEV